MRDTCKNQFEPQRFYQVGRGCVVRSKYGPKLPPFAPYCTIFCLSLTPTADPVKSLGFKMVCTTAPHIVLDVFTTLRALLKSGLCATQLCIRSDTASYSTPSRCSHCQLSIMPHTVPSRPPLSISLCAHCLLLQVTFRQQICLHKYRG